MSDSLQTRILNSVKARVVEILEELTLDTQVPAERVYVRMAGELAIERDGGTKATAVVICETPGSSPGIKRRIGGKSTDYTDYVTVLLVGPANRVLKTADPNAASADPDWRAIFRAGVLEGLHATKLTTVTEVQRVMFEQAPLDLTAYEVANLWVVPVSFKVLSRVTKS